MADIKFPTGPKGVDMDLIDATDQVARTTAVTPANVSVAEGIDASAVVSPADATEMAVAVAGVDPALVAMIDDIRAGRISLDEAVGQLVEEAVSAVQSALSPAQSEDLRAMLKESIATDPSLAALAEELGAAR